jgi:hypothetical protein
MFAGHMGAALAIGRAEPGINVGILVFAALMLDVLLWTFVLLGWESVTIPADFASTHQAAFNFPWSHGLAANAAPQGGASLGLGRAGYACALRAASGRFPVWTRPLLAVRRARAPASALSRQVGDEPWPLIGGKQSWILGVVRSDFLSFSEKRIRNPIARSQHDPKYWRGLPTCQCPKMPVLRRSPARGGKP